MKKMLITMIAAGVLTVSSAFGASVATGKTSVTGTQTVDGGIKVKVTGGAGDTVSQAQIDQNIAQQQALMGETKTSSGLSFTIPPIPF